MEDALGIFGLIDEQAHGEALRLVKMTGRCVGTHQQLLADDHARMDDFFAPFRRHLVLCRRAGVGHHGEDLAAEKLRVKLERSLALPVEEKIGIDLHHTLLDLFV